VSGQSGRCSGSQAATTQREGRTSSRSPESGREWSLCERIQAAYALAARRLVDKLAKCSYNIREAWRSATSREESTKRLLVQKGGGYGSRYHCDQRDAEPICPHY
jgi:hypothetical protein